jgi:hypothetical protein
MQALHPDSSGAIRGCAAGPVPKLTAAEGPVCARVDQLAGRPGPVYSAPPMRTLQHLTRTASSLAEPTVHVEGPPPGLPSGRYDVPRWAVGGAGSLVVAVGILYLAARLLRRRKPTP